MNEIQAEEIDSFQDGKFRLLRVTAPGEFPVPTKDGDTVQVPFAIGAVLLADSSDNIIVPPTSLDGAADLAGRILEGNQRARTNSQAVLALCAAVLGFRQFDEPLPPAAGVIVQGGRIVLDDNHSGPLS